MSDSEYEEDAALRQYMPASFGKQDRTANINAQVELSRRKVPTKEIKPEKKSDGDSDEDSDESDDSDNEDEYPVSHELIIKTHDRAVTTTSLDASGSRLITGSNDCTLKFHDFSAMSPTTVRAFRSVNPTAGKSQANAETHPVHQVLFNPISPSQVLVITSTPQAKVVNRDGEPLMTTVKGDMYLRDMHNTKGHIAELTMGSWHPTNRNVFVTAGTDSTLRTWDVNRPRDQKDVVVYKAKAQGSAGRSRMTAVGWGSNNVLVSAALDGSLVMWNGDGPYNRPVAEVVDAHKPETWTSGLDVSSDGRLVVTRGGDDTVKIWDTRKFSKPVNTAQHPSDSLQFPNSTIRFSPNSTSILTGSPTGDLHILNPATLRPELVTPVTPGSALITAFWHEKLNQIITSSANAETHVMYNPNTSNAGAKMVMTKAPKRRHIDDDPNRTMDLSQGISEDAVLNPNSFAARNPRVGITVSGKSRDPRRPHIPLQTPFGRYGPDEDHVKNSIPLSAMREEDPREALLKYADKARDDPMFTNAWKKTQPKAIYADPGDEEDAGVTKGGEDAEHAVDVGEQHRSKKMKYDKDS